MTIRSAVLSALMFAAFALRADAAPAASCESVRMLSLPKVTNRMLIAQAQLEDVTLVSDDEAFDDYEGRRVW